MPTSPLRLLLALAGPLLGTAAGLLPSSATAQSFPEPPPIEAAVAPDTPLDYAPGVDVLHYDLELGVGEGAGTFQGVATLRVALEDGAEELPLDLAGLAVDAVELDGTAVSGSIYENGVLRVPLASATSDTIQVRVAYSGTPDDALNLGVNVHGAPAAFADNWPNRARFWFPSVDHPSDKATVRYRIHAPAAWSVVANGHLVGPATETPALALGPETGPRRTWTWDVTVPIPTYTMVLGAAEMEVRVQGRVACGQAPATAEQDGCVEISWWAFPQDTANAARIFRRAPEMVQRYTDLIGPFPYEKLANVQSSTRFGGMENSSAIFYTGQGLADGTLSEATVAHEIAHQWFGDAVTETSWTHLWLSEGFATYFAALFYEMVGEDDAFHGMMEEARAQIVDSPVSDQPVVDHYANLYDLLNTNSYQKGGWVLHMLRHRLGDEDFFGGIREYVRRYRHGTALTADLRAAFEDVSGDDLETFFQQWIFEPGFPVLEVSDGWTPDGDGGTLRVEVRQVQKAAWPRFQAPLEVVAHQDGVAFRSTLWLSGEESVLELDLPGTGAPDRLEVDPEGRLLMGEPVRR